MLSSPTNPVPHRIRFAFVVGAIALAAAACSVEQGTAPPDSATSDSATSDTEDSTETDPPTSEPPATEPASTEPPIDTEPPTTEASTGTTGGEAFCAASGDFWVPTEALDYIDDTNGAAAEQLFVDMGRLIDAPISSAPDEAAAAPALQMKSVLRTIVPFLDEIDFEIARADEVSDPAAFGEAINEFSSIANELEEFLSEGCGFDAGELQDAAANYASGVSGTTPVSTDSVDPGTIDDVIESTFIQDESGTISVDVPAEWTDVNPAPSTEYLSVQASADLPAFLSSFTEPGMFIEVYPSTNGAVDAATGFDAVRQSFVNAGCNDGEAIDYDDGVYVGTEVVLDCAPGTDLITIGGTNDAEDAFFIVAMLVPDNDPGIRDLIVESFIVD